MCSFFVTNKIILSGQGADEIFSDYGFRGKKFYKPSNFGGLFPDDLSEIFLWNSFINVLWNYIY